MHKFAKKYRSFLSAINYQLIQKFKKCGSRSFFGEENILYGGDLAKPTPQQSFGSLLFSRMVQEERRNDVFQVDAVTGVEMTTKECLEKSVAVAKRLQEEGVQKGDTILLVGRNSMNMNISLIGIFLSGAIPLSLSNKTSLDDFQKIINFLKPKYFGCDGKYLFYFKKALTGSSDSVAPKIFILNPWIFLDEPSSTLKFEDFIKGREENFESFQPPEVNNPTDELALLVKVNSERVEGKLAGITHFNINSIVARFDSMENLRNFKQEVILMVQKIVWMSGLYSLLLSCCCGAKLIVMEKFEEEKFLKAIQEFKVTTTFLYSSKCWQLLKFTSNQNYEMSSCKYFYSVDGFLPSFYMTKLKEKYGILSKNCCGFPEFTGSVLETSGDINNGSTGKLMPQSYGKIISYKTYKNAGPNEEGELCLKGPTLCKGYINDEKTFKSLLDSQGFFLTGHYGYYDDNGDFFLIDTIVDLIQYKNYKISSKELEAHIKSLDSVKDACVAGLEHETDGAYPFAFVSLQKGKTITEQEIIKRVNANMPDYKQIRGVVIVAKVPRNKESGKIDRKVFKKALKRFRVKITPDSAEPLNEKIQVSGVEQKKEEEAKTP